MAPQEDALAAQQRLIKAMTARDAAALDNALAEDLFFIHASSAKDNKQSLIEALLSGALLYRSITLSEVETRGAGESVVFVGKAELTSLVRGGRIVESVRFASHWIWRTGRWQLLGWQATALPQ